MTLEILQKEMIAAMKSGNKSRKETISSLVGAVKKTAIDEKCRDNITEELVNKVIMKEKKIVQDMIDNCPASREDLLNELNGKLAKLGDVCESYIGLTYKPEEIDSNGVLVLRSSNIKNGKINFFSINISNRFL